VKAKAEQPFFASRTNFECQNNRQRLRLKTAEMAETAKGKKAETVPQMGQG